jgi:FkbM family methyltransferase|tara:strand:- start:77 stop:826 length:750 start_codon:yes stop_codon:yes gene_type:complete
MLVRAFYFIARRLCKIIGLPFTFSHDGEDLSLLKYLSNLDNGIYVDIGSHQPVWGSNTFLFYLLGWKGVCIDPLPNLKNKYQLIRKRDKFINAAVFGSKSKTKKDLNFYYYKNNRDNSTFDPERVIELKNKFGREPSSVIPVPKIDVVEMLSSVEIFFKESKEINLLNLDIEGFEIDILEDFFSCSVRPWIVCVEEIGVLAENIENGEIYKLMKNNGYILGSRTFLSSIYVLESKLDSLPSHYIKELKF